MKTKWFKLLLLMVGSFAFSQNYLSEEYANFHSKNENGNLTFISFKQNSGVSASNGTALIKNLLQLNPNSQLVQTKSETDYLGHQHETYKQYVNGAEVEFNSYIVHSKDGYITSVNGLMENIELGNQYAAIKSSDDILNLGMNFIGGEVKELFKDERILVILPKTVTNEKDRFAYKYILSINNSGRNEYVYLDAVDGTVLYKTPMSHSHATRPNIENPSEELAMAYDAVKEHINSLEKKTITSNLLVQGTAQTQYSGTRSIETSQLNDGTYQLYDSNRDIYTSYNSGQDTSVLLNLIDNGNTVDNAILASTLIISDNDNNWTATEWNINQLQAALDAHWGTATVYDFFKNRYNRNSYNGNNGAIRVMYNSTFYQTNYKDNATWLTLDPFGYNYGLMNIGLGSFPQNSNGFSELAPLDVMAHEFGHGVVTGLVYARESGALNEGIADVWGAVIEFNAAPEKIWSVIGEEIVHNGTGGLRFLNDPKIAGNASTYGGQYWQDTTPSGCPNPDDSNDYCGVHVNSGVFYHWFYLLAVGGSGTNDNGYQFNIMNGIGLNNAADLVYSSISSLTPNMTFNDMKNITNNVAVQLHGANSNIHKKSQAAWCAVGVMTGSDCANLSTTELNVAEIKIYPNPATDFINIDRKSFEKATYKIHNILGQVVAQGELNNNKINVSEFSKGAYVLTLSSKEGTITQKFIKK